MEYNFNTWDTPEVPETPEIPGPFYYPDLSGNGYHLDDNYGKSFQIPEGPPGNPTGGCVLANGMNTYFGSNATVSDENFNFGTNGSFSVFWCMQLPKGLEFSENYPILANFVLAFPFLNLYLSFSGSPSQVRNRILIGYQEVNPSQIPLNILMKPYVVNNEWHTYCSVVDRTNGTINTYIDAAFFDAKSWDISKNTNLIAKNHEITLFGSNVSPRIGFLGNNPPVPMKFGGFELYDEVLGSSVIQALHTKYMV